MPMLVASIHIRSIIGEYLTELRVLILADNCIWDISPLSNLKHLHYLELFLNRIYDLSPLRDLHELVDVNISYNGGIYLFANSVPSGAITIPTIILWRENA